jgi:hypothetical protein
VPFKQQVNVKSQPMAMEADQVAAPLFHHLRPVEMMMMCLLTEVAKAAQKACKQMILASPGT